ncbi:MAG: DUF488 family protein [Candidatus Tectomicrobia bacterium]|jgi:uncharacterized protein YeaO (DUF488 family)|nr:DUF488 family protein [Candidatus Tectomicrobia bacterium]
MIQVKRVYDRPEPADGARFLVERLWPRGVKKTALPLSGWLKEVAPSDALRRWFGHDPAKWEEFQRRYFAELDSRPEAWHAILEAARRGHVTFLYSARDTEHNNAVALKTSVEDFLRQAAGKARGARQASKRDR